MSNWLTRHLNDLGSVDRGRSRHRPRNDPILFGGPYPFFQTGEVKAAPLYLRDYSQTYSEEGLAQSRLWPPGTLCITIAANIADTAVLAVPGCFPDSIVGFIADPQVADVRFVKYSLDALKFRMLAISRGTTQDNLALDKLLSFELSVPPLDVQRKIGTLLAAHDELVENNLRRIRIVEEAAEAVFREWFVNLRFPGYESNDFEDTPIGPVPSGFRVEALAASVKFVPGIEPGSENYLSTPSKDLVRFYRVGDLGEAPRASVWIPWDLASQRIHAHDIALTLDGTVGRVAVGLEGSFSSGIRKVVPTDGSVGWAYIYELLKSDRIQDIIRAHARGTTIMHAGSAVKYMIYPRPPAALIGRFESIVRPMIELRLNLEAQNVNLRAIRDLLVPKLTTGELDVAQVNIAADWLAT